MLLHPWPDNLRGIDRIVHRLCSEPASGAVRRATLEPWLRSEPASSEPAPVPAPVPARRSAPFADRGGAVMAVAKGARPSREERERVLAEAGGSIRAAAKHYERDRRQIYRWLELYGPREKAD